MKNLPTIFLVFLTPFVFFLFSSCNTSSKIQQKSKKPGVSEVNKLESSALLIEGTRQKVKGNFESAVLHYAEAIEKDPTNCAAFYELAKIHALGEEYADALVFAQKAQQLDPSNLYYNVVLADIYALNNQIKKTIEIEKRLIKENPANSHLYIGHAETLKNINKFKEAIEVYDLMEKNLGFSDDLAIERQDLYMQIGKPEKAIEDVKRLVEMFPDEIQFLDYLANLYTSTGMNQEAHKVYEQMRALDPLNPYPLLLLADYFQKNNETEKAFEFVTLAFRSPALEVSNKERIMFSFYQSSAKDSTIRKQALELCQVFIEANPESAVPYYIYADFLFRDKKYDDSKENYKKSLSIEPNNMPVWEQLLYIDSELSDYESMLENATNAIEYFFEYPSLFYYQAISAYNLKKYEIVTTALEQAIPLVVHDNDISSDFYTLMADAYGKLESHEKADNAYTNALQRNPKNAYALNNYAYSLSVRKADLEIAEEMSKLSNELRPNNNAFQDTYGWILYQLGDYEEARLWIEKAMENMTEDRAVIIEHYGDVMYKLGETEKAISYWEKAATAGEGSKFLNQKINDKTLYE